MHTVRNRRASLPRQSDTRKAAVVVPEKCRTTREELGFMLRAGTAKPPAFPGELIIPAHRGAVITPVVIPPLVAVPSPPAQALLTKTMPTQAMPASSAAHAPGKPGRKAARKAARRAAAIARAAQQAAAEPQPASALEQLAVAVAPPPAPQEAPQPPAGPEVAPAQPSEAAVAMTVEMTTLADRALALADEPAAAPQDASAPLAPPAPLAPVMPGSPVRPFAPIAPLPRNMALAPRRRGFVDTLAFALLDSGRRLARWSSLRRRAEEDREKLRKAEARMHAMEAQLAALQALQEHVRQAGG